MPNHVTADDDVALASASDRGGPKQHSAAPVAIERRGVHKSFRIPGQKIERSRSGSRVRSADPW
jgi:hypothetical protein